MNWTLHCGHWLLLNALLSPGELGLSCILLATSFLLAILTSRVKALGGVVGAEGL